MSEIGDLKTRVESAVERLQAVKDQRQHESEELTQKLAGLEEKFAARAIELDYCQQKIADLERANGELNTMVEAMLRFLESDLGEAAEQAVFRASAMAEELVGGKPAPGPSGGTRAPEPEPRGEAPEPEPQPEPEDIVEILEAEPVPAEPVAAEPVEVEIVEAEPVEPRRATVLRFQDVSQDELDVEDLLDPNDTDLPQSVVASLAVARPAPEPAVAEAVEEAEDEADDVADAVEDAASLLAAIEEETDLTADLAIPEIDDGSEPVQDDRETDIRALMARLEKAAARARGDSNKTEPAEKPRAHRAA